MIWRILEGDCRARLAELEPGSVQCVVTSPPYWGLRDYGIEGQIGLEPTPEEYVATMVDVFREVRRVLRNDGTVWLNLGDSYASSPPGNKTDGVEKLEDLRASRCGERDLREVAGSGTTGVVALRLGRSFIGIELSPTYAEMARRRIETDDSRDDTGSLFNVEAT